MAQQLRWWVIPGALIVLLRVVTLDSGPAPVRATGPAPRVTPELRDLPDLVTARDASGSRTRPLALSATAAKALVVDLQGHEGQRGQMTIWRHLDTGREATPWLTLRPKVRGDGTIPIAGLLPGCYDIEVVFGEGAAAERLLANAAEAPGVVEFVAASPLR
ncbi:MAG: hypothetical protein K8J09_04180 [Planctomycetes bacterium]|nr:hypothetical protein [Planctomycetota bacterium]MCC7397704.1 hypothetical protein [Planctomycetota bacterium]